jgi:hypothetical protein
MVDEDAEADRFFEEQGWGIVQLGHGAGAAAVAVGGEPDPVPALADPTPQWAAERLDLAVAGMMADQFDGNVFWDDDLAAHAEDFVRPQWWDFVPTLYRTQTLAEYIADRDTLSSFDLMLRSHDIARQEDDALHANFLGYPLWLRSHAHLIQGPLPNSTEYFLALKYIRNQRAFAPAPRRRVEAVELD